MPRYEPPRAVNCEKINNATAVLGSTFYTTAHHTRMIDAKRGDQPKRSSSFKLDARFPNDMRALIGSDRYASVLTFEVSDGAAGEVGRYQNEFVQLVLASKEEGDIFLMSSGDV